MSTEPTREGITKALQLGEAITEADAEAIRYVMRTIGAELETIAVALRPFMHQAGVAVEEIGRLHEHLFPNADGEPRAMNTSKKYPTSTPAWARRRK